MIYQFCIVGILCAVVSATSPPCTCVKPPPSPPKPLPPTCPANEVYSECGNNACQNTCANPNVGLICKPICTPGCICRSGYLRNTKGVCVPPCRCDTCGPNEIFDLYKNTECVDTCMEPTKSATCVPNMPLAGCICRRGLVRNETGTCVKPETCGCGGDPNAYLDSCGDRCPITCANKDTPIACPAICDPPACRCRPGYVRNIYNKCILPEECPYCGPNEVFNCGSACDNECATLGEPCPIVNIKCTERCYCIEGYARNSRGVCIPVDQCPPRVCKTDRNAIIVPCGDPCPITCDNMDNPPLVCPAMCIVNGCKCKPGYVLGPDKLCIKPKYCPKPPSCGCNEVYNKCPPKCPPEVTCESYMIGIFPLCPVQLNPTDCTPACVCKEGYVRNKYGECVLPEQCCTASNTELVSCPNPCPGGTCAQPTFAPCRMACQKFGCQCKAGYVKISDTNPKCVPEKYCKYYCK